MSFKFNAMKKTKLNTTQVVETKDDDQSLSDRLETYLSQHAVKLQMNTNYLLHVFTVQSEDDNSKIIAVMDSVQAAGTHVSYKDYMTKDRDELMESQMNIELGRHFTYLKRKKQDSQI